MKYLLLLLLLLPLSSVAQTRWDVSVANGISTYHLGLANFFIPAYSLGIGVKASGSALNGPAGSIGVFLLHDRIKVLYQRRSPAIDSSYWLSNTWLAFAVQFGQEFKEGKFRLTVGVQPEVKLRGSELWMGDGSSFNLSLLSAGQAALTKRINFELGYSFGIINIIERVLLPPPNSPPDIRRDDRIHSGRLMATVSYRISK